MWVTFWLLGLLGFVSLPELHGEMDLTKFDISCHSHLRSKLPEQSLRFCKNSANYPKYHNSGCMDACLMELGVIIVTENHDDPSTLVPTEDMGELIYEAFTENHGERFRWDKEVLKNTTKAAALIHKHCAGKEVALKPKVDCIMWEPLTKCVVDVFNCVLK